MQIFALATSNQRTALHLHRISGPGIFAKLAPFLRFPHSKAPFSLEKITSHHGRIFYLHILDQQGELLDDALISFFKGPHSFTGEDTMEISLHGNPLLSAKLQSLLRSLGMRDALPGEFTHRAYLQGKLDLAQAEGIQQLIHSETQGGILLARQAVSGVLSQEMVFLREKIIELLSYLEAHIDFAVDEVGHFEPQTLLPLFTFLEERLQALIGSYSTGLKVRTGLKIALFGAPNAGKSSLYNALLQEERAIVTDIPGTTRDILEERLTLQGKDFVLIDTAGLRKSDDVVEKIGIARSLKIAPQADILCLLLDASQIDFAHANAYITGQVEEFLSKITLNSEQKLVLILSKCDLLTQQQHKTLQTLSLPQGTTQIVIISQNSLEDLNTALLSLYDMLLNTKKLSEHPTLISTRQQDKARLALDALQEAKNLAIQGDFPEKIASQINSVQSNLDEILGEISLDSIYEKIFSTFCIGK